MQDESQVQILDAIVRTSDCSVDVLGRERRGRQGLGTAGPAGADSLGPVPRTVAPAVRGKELVIRQEGMV